MVNDIRQKMAEAIIAEIEKGTPPWQVPWDPNKHLPRPHNPVSNTQYRGVNSLVLSIIQKNRGYTDARWCTFKQAQDKGWCIRKGKKASPIYYWQFHKEVPLLDENKQPIMGEEGKPLKTIIELEKPYCKYYQVFNGDQIDGIPSYRQTEYERLWTTSERADRIIKNSLAKIAHDQEKRAYYDFKSDSIHLPPQSHFDQAEKYYATILHELGHWTGHVSRLDRKLDKNNTDELYAKEELRAELASYYMAFDLNIPSSPTDHASYIDSYAKILKESKDEIFRTAKSADEIAEYVLCYEKKRAHQTRKENPKPGTENRPELSKSAADSLKPTSFGSFLESLKKEVEADKAAAPNKEKDHIGISR